MFRAYAQLLRIPNVFTAMADIFLGWLAVWHWNYQPPPVITLFLLLGATFCLYCGGMVLNDFFDMAEDRRERPFRPIPSGRVSWRTAGVLGIFLLLAGVGLGAACQ